MTIEPLMTMAFAHQGEDALAACLTGSLIASPGNYRWGVAAQPGEAGPLSGEHARFTSGVAFTRQ
ncbi:hypothetical protein GCM10009830_24270 [Glycomyces endophyticus]|uniref:Uncharacterized protein n=1 Tax=Glycomyces endophyticus TaxID=480996 RepID=A0ABP4SSB6_9ACTN